MRRQGPVAAALAFCTILSGCVASQGATGPSGDESTPSRAGSAAGEYTGTIQGTVTDDTLKPIEGANVTVLGLGISALTDASGKFVVGEIPPGKARLVATMLGYEPAGRAVDVAAGAVAETNFILAPLPNVEPFHVTIKQAGLIGCSVHVRESNSNASVTTLSYCSNLYYYVSSQLDKFRLDWDLGRIDNVSGLWVETTWRSTQPAGNGLTAWWLGYRDNLVYSMARISGKSPIRAAIAEDDFTTNVGNGKGPSCANPACHMTSFHYAWGNAFNGAYQVDAGTAFQQRFDDYVTVFYYGDFPEQFTAIAEA